MPTHWSPLPSLLSSIWRRRGGRGGRGAGQKLYLYFEVKKYFRVPTPCVLGRQRAGSAHAIQRCFCSDALTPVWHEAMVLVCLPLAAPIGLSPLHILTLCGSERVLVVTETPDDLSCLTTAEGGGGRNACGGHMLHPPPGGPKFFKLTAEAKFWLSASNIGKGGGGAIPPPPAVYCLLQYGEESRRKARTSPGIPLATVRALGRFHRRYVVRGRAGGGQEV